MDLTIWWEIYCFQKGGKAREVLFVKSTFVENKNDRFVEKIKQITYTNMFQILFSTFVFLLRPNSQSSFEEVHLILLFILFLIKFVDKALFIFDEVLFDKLHPFGRKKMNSKEAKYSKDDFTSCFSSRMDLLSLLTLKDMNRGYIIVLKAFCLQLWFSRSYVWI